jgi:hypothetical protein
VSKQQATKFWSQGIFEVNPMWAKPNSKTVLFVLEHKWNMNFMADLFTFVHNPLSSPFTPTFFKLANCSQISFTEISFVHMAEYTTYYAYTPARYLSTPNWVSPGFDAGIPSILPDMDGEAGTFLENCYWSETFCLK